jgi:Fe-S oxidoreductase
VDVPDHRLPSQLECRLRRLERRHKTRTAERVGPAISHDLTYHDPATLGNSGGPLTKDQTSVEYYATVFIIEESPLSPKVIWTGSDDGKVFLTRDGGLKWEDVTPKDMAKFTRVSSVDASRFGECIAYVAGNRFQLDDNRPYLWKTTNCGATWTRIDNGIDASEFTRVVREDPNKRGLLVAGTERGVWYSTNDGATGKACVSICPSFRFTISPSRAATSSSPRTAVAST